MSGHGGVLIYASIVTLVRVRDVNLDVPQRQFHWKLVYSLRQSNREE